MLKTIPQLDLTVIFDYRLKGVKNKKLLCCYKVKFVELKEKENIVARSISEKV